MNDKEVLIESNTFMRFAIKKVATLGFKVLSIHEDVVHSINDNIIQIRYKIFTETLQGKKNSHLY